jgi:hypothetical protein
MEQPKKIAGSPVILFAILYLITYAASLVTLKEFAVGRTVGLTLAFLPLSRSGFSFTVVSKASERWMNTR